MKVTDSIKDGIGKVERVFQSTPNSGGSPAPIADTIEDTRDVIDDNYDTVWDKYDELIDLDPELSGSVNAISQSATNATVDHSTSERSDIDDEAVKECRKLYTKLQLDLATIDIFRNLLRYGNDINKAVYENGEGVQSLQSLPINTVTIVDSIENISGVSEPDDNSAYKDVLRTLQEEFPDLGQQNHSNMKVFNRGLYLLNENNEGKLRKIHPDNILHFSVDHRSNWHKDQMGRKTYGVWGKSRIAPLEFSLKVKYNTLRNKVAMDDKLVAREIYYVDTKELFGDIPDRDERRKRAKKYVAELKEKIEKLGPDERPALPKEVQVEVIGPEGKAIDQTDFIEQQNNSTAAALTFPMAGLGRGTTSVKAGEEISSLWAENNIMNLRKTINMGVRKLFEIHLKTVDEKFIKGELDEATPIGDIELVDDLHIPTLVYEPFKEEDLSERTIQIERLRRQKVITAEEARDKFGVDTDDESMEKLKDEYNNELDPTVRLDAEHTNPELEESDDNDNESETRNEVNSE